MVGPATANASNNVDAVQLAADQNAIYFFSAPPSTLMRKDLMTTVLTAITAVPAGANRLVASSKYLYLVEGTSIVRCRKEP
jgi:hypothetical protein